MNIYQHYNTDTFKWETVARNGNHEVIEDLISEGMMQFGGVLADVPDGSGDYRVLKGGE
jgi:hypothetical protein